MNKKLMINANLLRKESEFRTKSCVAEKAIGISHAEFNVLKRHPLRDNTLMKIKGKFLVSYNDCPEIRELWDKPNIYIEEISRLNNLAQRYEGGCQYAELLISNYDTSERTKTSHQMTLFEQGEFV